MVLNDLDGVRLKNGKAHSKQCKDAKPKPFRQPWQLHAAFPVGALDLLSVNIPL